ncbi:MAG: type II toxin-antitoxin system HigB family toxin [Candidatus Binataceae bacterium]|nr:type II toxin-antitoxin system HigB family toxin [Candidatus Binataceae bacterium]
MTVSWASHEAPRAAWRNSAEVKRSYGIVSADRVVFNIKGN